MRYRLKYNICIYIIYISNTVSNGLEVILFLAVYLEQNSSSNHSVARWDSTMAEKWIIVQDVRRH